MCIYCEIVGYTPNGTPIQKGYDYGCLPTDEVKSKLMVYRITYEDKEMEVNDVIAFGQFFERKHGDIIIEFPLMYGTLRRTLSRDFYNRALARECVGGFEEREEIDGEMEPMCINKVPREGFVIRKANDPIKEAWKLKTANFREGIAD